MAESYDYFKRIQSESWLIAHIENLIDEAKTESSTSSVLYAAFEMRNLIERICYNLILMSSNKTEWEEIEKTAKGKQGIRRSNDKYKTLKYRFQTFSEAIGRIANLPIKAFDYKKAEDLENELGEYIHSYTRNQEDMDYASDFIQNGLAKIEEALAFVKSYFVQIDGKNVYGILNFSSLSGEYKTEFENWKIGTTSDTEALFKKLEELNKKEPLGITKKE